MAIMSYDRSYATARGVVSVLEVVGWIAVVFGALIALTGFATGGFFMGGAGMPGRILAAVPGLLIVLNGLIAVANAQLTRAHVDTAEMTRDMLQIARRQEFAAFGNNAASKTVAAVPSFAVIPSHHGQGGGDSQPQAPQAMAASFDYRAVSDASDLKPGDKVMHKTYGAGTVVSPQGGLMAVVEFESGRAFTVDVRDLAVRA